jgi:hypothetical protein
MSSQFPLSSDIAVEESLILTAYLDTDMAPTEYISDLTGRIATLFANNSDEAAILAVLDSDMQLVGIDPYFVHLNVNNALRSNFVTGKSQSGINGGELALGALGSVGGFFGTFIGGMAMTNAIHNPVLATMTLVGTAVGAFAGAGAGFLGGVIGFALLSNSIVTKEMVAAEYSKQVLTMMEAKAKSEFLLAHEQEEVLTKELNF